MVDVLVPTPNVREVDRLLRRWAKVLAPYIAAELAAPAPSLSPHYDAQTIEGYAEKLTDDVIKNAIVLYELLAVRGKVSSVELADALGVTSPRALPGMLTTPLKRRARELKLPYPFDGGEGSMPYGGIADPAEEDDKDRTYWADRDGIAERMVLILKGERATRLLYGPRKDT